MKSLEERKKDREQRMHLSQQETEVSVATRAELQVAAEKAVVKADEEAGVKSAPLASQQKAAGATKAENAAKAVKTPSPFDVPPKTAKPKK